MKKVLFALLLSLAIQVSSQKIPFKTLPSGHMIVPAKIEGVEGNFILDTGAGINLFFNDFVSKLPQKPSSYNFFTGFRATGERLDIPLFKNKEITFGGKSFKSIPFSTAEMKVPGIDGLLSLKMFENQDIVIDYKNQEISFSDAAPKSYSKSIDIFLSTQQDDTVDIFTYITLNNKYKIKVLLDSGAGSNSFWFSDKLISTLSLDPKTMQLIEKESEFNKSVKTKIYKGSIAQISNEFVTLKNQNVMFVENLIYEGKTSINWLGNKIIISVKNKKIYILE
ncbi:retropepsin-like aspartic protease [Chryseobacterium sp.]|uniref:retropepsin-like aspartic protease n=1 Tax=Chryseobacterium sp. TaxID=1871047 RepID=UPI002FC78BE9